MKRASAAPPEPEPRAGVPLTYLVALGSAAFCAVLLISPGCERGADAPKIGDPDATTEQVSVAVQRLCATEQGRKEMTTRLESLDRATRAPALALASGQPKCLERIPGALRAEYELWKGGAAVDAVAAVGADAIEPALGAASDATGANRRVALGALGALADKLNEDQKQRALKRAEPLAVSKDAEDARAAHALLVTLGVVPPEPEPEEEDDDDFQLGGGGLRLQLGGGPPPGAAPKPGGGVLLREPTLELKERPKGGVLFDASKEP